jgi:hypothetical protein
MPAFSTRIHAILDLLLALVLVSAPWWAGFAGPNPETWIAIGVGVAVIAYALATDNELGLAKRLQMPLHLWLDALAGILLAASPWVFSFDQRVWLPHLIVGLLLLALAIVSHTIPGYERRGAARAGVD